MRSLLGRERWSQPREQIDGSPRAILEDSIAIELHEYGPMLDFVVQHVDQIPNYVSALAAVVSAWAAVRTLRRQQLPKDDNRREDGTVMTIGGLRVESNTNLAPAEVTQLVTTVATIALERSAHLPSKASAVAVEGRSKQSKSRKKA
jgi:hypothetical protein